MASGAKPFVKWVGGKRQLLHDIVLRLPESFKSGDELTYVEPFVGGGAVLFHLLENYPNIKRAVINDVNPKLIAAYRVVRDNPKELASALLELQKEYIGMNVDDDRKTFYLGIRKRFNDEELSDLEIAAFLIFLNRTCFNGLYRVNSKGHFNVPFGKYPNPTICDIETLMADSELLQKVEIMQGDFEQVERYANAGDFVYIDPPYRPLDATSCFNSYDKGGFDDEEQSRLKRFVDRLTANDCAVMLSNSDGKGRNPDDTFFDDLYNGYVIERVYAKRAVNANPEKRGKLTELLVRNYSCPITKESSSNVNGK